MRERHKIDTVYSHPIPIRKHFSSRCLFYNLALLLLLLLFNLYQFIPSLSLQPMIWSIYLWAGWRSKGTRHCNIYWYLRYQYSIAYLLLPTDHNYYLASTTKTVRDFPLSQHLPSKAPEPSPLVIIRFSIKVAFPTGHHKIRDDYLIQMLSINKCPRHLETITVQSQTPQHCPQNLRGLFKTRQKCGNVTLHVSEAPPLASFLLRPPPPLSRRTKVGLQKTLSGVLCQSLSSSSM